MVVDIKALIAQIRRPIDRERISLYVSSAVYSDFRKKCEANRVSPSEFVEYIMAQFNESDEVLPPSAPPAKKKKSSP